MPRPLRNYCLLSALLFTFLLCLHTLAQAHQEQVQVAPPMRRIGPPPAEWNADQLEKQADELRAHKGYLDALDYYDAALTKVPKAANLQSAVLQNKIGITNLQLQRFGDARKHFQRSIKLNKQYADAYNNLGVIFYLGKKYSKAIKQYQKALSFTPNSASFYSNLGAAHFSKKEFEKAMLAYSKALELDPDILQRTSATGVTAQMSSPEDRAHYDYVVAKMYARLGVNERSLEYLRKAMEEGYKDINNVYKDAEFVAVRKDPRFHELMAARPPAIPE